MKIEFSEWGLFAFVFIALFIFMFVTILLMFNEIQGTHTYRIVEKQPIIQNEYKNIIVQVNASDSQCILINGEKTKNCEET